MKRWFRNPRVQALLGRVLAGYLRLALSTIRWRRVDAGQVEALWSERRGMLLCFWHARLLLAPACWPLDRAPPVRALISLSPDGEFLAQGLARMGIPAIRGSTAKKHDPAKSKGGAAAFRETLKWMAAGGTAAITPDGPRGPKELMTEGAPMLAALSAAPVLFVGLACRPCIRLRTWDAMVLPLPFARGAIVWDEPFRIDRSALAAGTEETRRAWSDRLTALTGRAEELLR